jgi:drug/metabolite transporter (DMT)-like permease
MTSHSATALAARPNRLKGIVLMSAAGTLFSIGGILVREMTLDSGAIVFWRSAFMIVVLVAVLGARHGRRWMTQIIAMGWTGVASGFFLGVTFYSYIFALGFTTVANTLVMMSTCPFLAALIARVFLGEPVALKTVAAMVLATVGVTVMVWSSLDAGHGIIGEIIAFGVPLAMAINLTFMRRAAGRIDMVPAVLLAGVFTLLGGIPLAYPFAISWADLFFVGLMGIFQLAVPLIFLTLATRHLRAAEIALLGLLEMILAPIWVWLALGERPSDLGLFGGGLVLAALIYNATASIGRAQT